MECNPYFCMAKVMGVNDFEHFGFGLNFFYNNYIAFDGDKKMVGIAKKDSNGQIPDEYTDFHADIGAQQLHAVADESATKQEQSSSWINYAPLLVPLAAAAYVAKRLIKRNSKEVTQSETPLINDFHVIAWNWRVTWINQDSQIIQTQSKSNI